MTEIRRPTLSAADRDAALRKGATDEEIAATLRDPDFWAYIVRDPTGKVACYGKDKTRAECERWAVEHAELCAAEMFFGERGDWRLKIWPPTAPESAHSPRDSDAGIDATIRIWGCRPDGSESRAATLIALRFPPHCPAR
jgi:hypothetical protein